MAPGYEVGFGFLRGVAIDQHVVARERLADLADSLMPRHPELLGISEDEGTAWVVRGDTAEIMGRNKAFVYGGKDAPDVGRPFTTLYPGDRYDMATRRVMHRASTESALSDAAVDAIFKDVAASGAKATVLVARGGKVLVDRAYGIAPQAHYMPTTTVPNFALGGIAQAFDAVLTRVSGQPVPTSTDASYSTMLTRRIYTPIGMHKTAVVDGKLESNVDELYRFALGLEHRPTFFADSSGRVSSTGDDTMGWQADRYRGATRLSAFGTADGKRNAFVRLPDSRVAVIILTDRDDVDARALADRLLAGLNLK